MKTPEEIKKGLECCHNPSDSYGTCLKCPYESCVVGCRNLIGDALAYIQQLESRLAQVERERDAMFHDLFRYGPECRTCKNHGGDYASLPCSDCVEASKISKVLRWQWRGVCPENSKEEK